MVHSIVRTGALAAALLTCQMAGLLAFLAAATDGSSAQTFPTQPIRIIVATPPGGIADLVGRTFAQKLSAGPCRQSADTP
jgi:tripartite-type tricarboxylate transporter receptor subunit TctC